MMSLRGIKYVQNLVSNNFITSQRTLMVGIIQNAKVKQTVEESLGIQKPPTKPLAAFFRFLADKRAELVQQNPEAKQTELAKMATALWNKDMDARKKYEDEQITEYGVYLKELHLYNNSLTETQKEAIKQAKAQIKCNKIKKEFKKVLKEQGKPCRPLSAYSLFLKLKKSECTDIPQTDWLKMVAKQWKEINPDDKARLQQESAKLKKIYEEEMIKWEEQMVASGNYNMVSAASKLNGSPRKKKPVAPKTGAYDTKIKKENLTNTNKMHGDDIIPHSE